MISERSGGQQREKRPRRPLVRAIGKGALLLGLTTGVVGMGEGRVVLSDLYHHVRHETASEKAISGYLQHAFGERIILRCLERAKIGAKGATNYELFTRRPMIRLTTMDCKALTDFAAAPTTPPDSDAVRAIHNAAHEYSHAGDKIHTRDEGKAECYAVQNTLPLAKAMGATHKAATLIEHKDADAFKIPADLKIFAHVRTYAIPNECRPGGNLDLRISDTKFPESNMLRL